MAPSSDMRLKDRASIDRAVAIFVDHHPEFEAMAKRVGPLPVRAIAPGFAGLARIVISQQVSALAAAAIHARFENHLPACTPHDYLAACDDTNIAIGLSRPKQRTLRAVAEAVRDGRIDLDAVADMPSADAIETLTALHGIGPWTAEVYLLFALGHPDIFPARDLALAEAARRHLDLPERPDPKTLSGHAERWQPHRSVAARLFWADYSLDPAA